MTGAGEALRESVRGAYSAAAAQPEGRHPFPVGAAFALSVGYPAELLSRLPEEPVTAFAGVADVSISAPIELGQTVVDLGCGAGLDSLIAAGRVGDSGTVIGFDFSAAMLGRAQLGGLRSGLSNVHFVQAAAESLPLPDSSIDVVLVNGIFNLNPFRGDIFRELARVLRPGGRVAGAELVLRDALPESLQTGNANWFS